MPVDTGIILIRHGETDWNKEEVFRGRVDIPLNDNGLGQAAAMADSLKDLDLKAVYCSPLSRARQTAEALCQGRNLKPQIREAFIDLSFGPWEGKSYNELAKLKPDQIRLWQEQPHLFGLPGTESLNDALERSFPELEALAEANLGRNIAIVSHRVILKLLLLAAMNLRSESFWLIRQDPCCINMLEYHRKKGFIIIRINESCHIEPPAVSFSLKRNH